MENYIITWEDCDGVHTQKRDDITRAWFFYKSIDVCQWKRLEEESTGNIIRNYKKQ